MRIVGIVGSRRRSSNEDWELLRDYCRQNLLKTDRIVSGGCPVGADRFAELIAKELGLTIIIHYPDWSIGRHAGLLRNTSIAEDCTHLIALVAPDRTGGTEDTIRKATKLNRQIVIL